MGDCCDLYKIQTVTQEKDEMRNMKDKSKGGGPIPPSNHRFLKFKEQER